MKLKMMYCFLALMIMLTLVSCSNESSNKENSDNLNKEGMPIVDKKITLDFFAGKAPATHEDWNDVLIYNEYEDISNIDINWEMVPFDSLSEKLNLALSGGSLPDAFHSANISSQDLLKYGEQGTLVPLNDLIDEYAPNFKAILEEYPELEKSITLLDGNIYSFPLVVDPDFVSYRLGTTPWINEEWLEELGMDMPKTTDEFYEYLKSAKNAEMGGKNGAPYGGADMHHLYTYLLGSFELGNKGIRNGNFDLDPQTGELRFFPLTEEYKELVKYMHRLYSEELIAQNIYSIDDSQYRSNVSDGIYGATNFWTPEGSIGKEAGEKFTNMPVLEGPNGGKEFVEFQPLAPNPGAFSITSDNEYPEATVRWIDYFYGDEGIKLYFMGVEGETYEVNEDGEIEYMDHILNSEEGLSLTQEQAKYLALPGTNPPTIMKQEYFVGPATTEPALEAAETIEPDLVEDPWPDFIFDSDDVNTVESLGADINKYVTEMRDKFITGEVSFENWEEYSETIKAMGLDEYEEVIQNAIDKYNEQ